MQFLMHPIRFLLGCLLAVLLSACDKGRDSRDENYAAVAAEDAAMNAAIAQAKETFPQFLAALRSQKLTQRNFALKKPYAVAEGGHEHMWIERIKEVDGGFEGIVANEAYDTKLVSFGQRVRLSAEEISDWKYVDDDVLVGGYTIRYFVDRLSPEEKRALEEQAGFKIQ